MHRNPMPIVFVRCIYTCIEREWEREGGRVFKKLHKKKKNRKKPFTDINCGNFSQLHIHANWTRYLATCIITSEHESRCKYTCYVKYSSESHAKRHRHEIIQRRERSSRETVNQMKGNMEYIPQLEWLFPHCKLKCIGVTCFKKMLKHICAFDT